LPQLAGDQSGLVGPSDPDGNVDPVSRQIDKKVGQARVNFQIRVGRAKAAQQ
jgi:hypothetical protein